MTNNILRKRKTHKKQEGVRVRMLDQWVYMVRY
jgi:hypothetical protein